MIFLGVAAAGFAMGVLYASYESLRPFIATLMVALALGAVVLATRV